jgi:hypothetical protein
MGTQAGSDPELTTAASLAVAEAIYEAQVILDEYTTNNIDPIIALKKIQAIIESEAVKEAMKAIDYVHR